MKKIFLLSFFLLLKTTFSSAQIGINTSGNPPAAGVLLDISSNSSQNTSPSNDGWSQQFNSGTQTFINSSYAAVRAVRQF